MALDMAITTVYVTTFCDIVALSRICLTLPSKTLPGCALTVKRAGCSGWIRVISASFTDAHTSSLPTSATKKTEAPPWAVGPTMSPTFTRRSRMMPLLGDLIVV